MIWRPSPNFGSRRDGALPDLIVLHYTAMESCAAACDRLCDPDCEVSAHYLIAEDGEVFQLVDEEMRAWHAGAGAWGDVTDVNSRSIGIELANTGADPFPDAQMRVLEGLLSDIVARWSIPPQRIIGHSDMAPGRKRDPGPLFDWQRLAAKGLSVWPEAEPAAATSSFRQCATTFGYPDSANDEDLLAAFRLRFRPQADGPLQAEDTRLIADLARRFPVDRAATSA
ncbi:N-acetylmuramoyl-L-alanine amidase [Aliiroseovarius sp. YM-037]|uniref:N-acetylmuramoyl-L-alanine amidase n=1 Tax=Aliiroseovarius sp. YM-037 TaxID=3341728 RepID=UPI003A80150F